MLNNSLTVTDKFIAAFEKEVDKSSPRTKGLLNYKERIKILSKSKNK